MVNHRVIARGVVPKPSLIRPPHRDGRMENAIKEHRTVFMNGKEKVKVPVYDRKKLLPGHAGKGPAIIEQYDSTTFIESEQNLRIDDFLNIIIE